MGLFERLLGGKKREDAPSPSLARRMAEQLDCPSELWEGEDEDSVMARYLALQEEGRAKGFVPLILIPSSILLEGLQHREHTPGALIAMAEKMDAEQLLNRLYQSAMPIGEEPEESFFAYQEGDKQEFFSSLIDYETKRVYRELLVAKIPAQSPWEAAAWAPMGGFNACPLNEEIAAVFRYWYLRHGAWPAAVGYDTWELWVERPTKGEKASLALAREQYGFCSDIVNQGVGSVGALAGVLKNSSRWYFWWD